MATTGTATLDFGAIGNQDNPISLAITGQAGILAVSQVEAWLRIEATTDHDIDELIADPIDVRAGNIVAGTGFTIYGSMPHGATYGTYKVDWIWN